MMLRTNPITEDIPNNKRIKFEIYTFIKIISTFFDLKPYQEEEIVTIFKSTWPYRTSLYNRIRFENTVLAICSHVMRENEVFNIYKIVPFLYSEETRIYNVTQIYSIVQLLEDIL